MYDNEVAMPFHTACFDIFMRLSRLRFGHIDINGLMSWYNLEGEWLSVGTFPHDPNVRRSASQWWEHKTGLEYLATNPIFIPRLGPSLRSAIQDSPSFNTRAGAFSLPEFPSIYRSSSNSRTTSSEASQDFFQALPVELRMEVIGYLGSKEIANLRLATRAFRQLPIYLWHRLLREEMPWLWEVWSNDVPYIWTTISAASLKEEKAAREAIDQELTTLRTVIRQEIPEMVEAWIQAEQDLVAGRPNSLLDSQAAALKTLVYSLPVANTNWYQLYTDITRHWSDLKGLHNRRRIWKAVEEIIRRIRMYREQGKVED